MHQVLYRVLQCLSLSGYNAQTDALVNSCVDFRNDIDLVIPTCKYRLNGRTRLFAACKYGNVARVRLLLQCRANAGADWAGHVPLVAAAEHGHVDIVRLLLNAPNVDANAVDAGTQTTALYSASERGHVAVVRLLCDRALRDRVDVQQLITPSGQEGRERRFSPLHVACRRNHVSIVRMLLDAGADLYAIGGKDDHYPPETPLLSAVDAGAADAIHELFRTSSRPCDAQDCWDILDHACYEKERLPALRALLSYCTGPSPFIDVTEMGNKFRSALRRVLLFWYVETVQLLLEIPHTDIWKMYGEDNEYFDSNDESVWSLAIAGRSDHTEVAEGTRVQVLGLLRHAMSTHPCPWRDPQKSADDKDHASSTDSTEDGDDDDIARNGDLFRLGCMRACFEAMDRGELAVVRFMMQVDPALLNCEAEYLDHRSNAMRYATPLIYAIPTYADSYCILKAERMDPYLAFVRELALMPGCDVNHRPREYDGDGLADTALEECCWAAASGAAGGFKLREMIGFLCALPGINICCSGGEGKDLPWGQLQYWASQYHYYKGEEHPFIDVVQAVADAYPNFNISDYTVEGKHPLVWACEHAPAFESPKVSTKATDHDTDVTSESSVEVGGVKYPYFWGFPVVRWLLRQPSINVNQVLPGMSEDARRFKCDAGWAEPRTFLMFIIDITSTQCYLLNEVLQHPSLDLKQVCNGKTALQHWALRKQDERDKIIRCAQEEDLQAVLVFDESAKQLLQGQGAGSTAKVAAALAGASHDTSGDAQQQGRKKRKRGKEEQD